MSTSGQRGPDQKGSGRSAFQWTMLYRDRPIMDTLAILIYHNLFGRFPGVQVMSVENGSIWVPYLLKAMDNMKGMGRNGPWPGGYVEGRPSEVFKQHVYVSPHHYGEDVADSSISWVSSGCCSVGFSACRRHVSRS